MKAVMRFSCLYILMFLLPVAFAAAPATPTNMTLQVAYATQATISWTGSSTVTGYYIERKTGTGSYVQLCIKTVASYLDPVLTPNTSYTYKVRSYVGTTFSNYSSELVVKTPSLVAPTGVKATFVPPDKVALSWTASTNGAYDYVVERKTGTVSYKPCQTIYAFNKNVDTDVVVPNTTYCYRVDACSGTQTLYSSEVPITIPGFAAPTNLVATAFSSSQINLSWQGTYNASANYLVTRMLNGVAVAGFTVKPTLTTFSDVGLKPGLTYSYKVNSYTLTTKSDYSNVASATTKAALKKTVMEPSSFNLPQSKNAKLCIFDAWGRVVAQSTTRNLAPGFYIARIRDDAGIRQTSFVVTTKSK